MKRIEFIIFGLLLGLAACAYAQVQDTRAYLLFNGGVHEISVSPNGTVWVGSLDRCCYATNKDSDWHLLSHLTKQSDTIISGMASVDRISFFNKDTAIMSGYIIHPGRVYVTANGGVTWVPKQLAQDDWMYGACIKGQNAWIVGGLAPHIYYTSDYGQHMKLLKLPAAIEYGLERIAMSTSTEGYATAGQNGMYATKDNWNTAFVLPTPVDQGIGSKSDMFPYDDAIKRLCLWNDYIIICQNGVYYYRNKYEVKWNAFKQPLLYADVDTVSNKLYALTKNNEILVYTTPTVFVPFTPQKLKFWPEFIKVVNNTVYAGSQSGMVGIITPNSIRYIKPYTPDEKISVPEKVYQSKNVKWGINYYDLCMSNDATDWYKEHTLPFLIMGIKPLSDTTAILWDENHFNYFYSVNTHSIGKYYPANPIKDFLSSPIKSVSFTGGVDGCFTGQHSMLKYEVVDKSTLQSKYYVKNGSSVNATTGFVKEIKTTELMDVLTSMDATAGRIPPIKDFDFTKEDIKQYKLSDTLIYNVLNPNSLMYSTTHYFFSVQFINEHNDTLEAYYVYYANNPGAWLLPLCCSFKGLTFNSYDIKLARFMKNCLPNDFPAKEAFDNSRLIKQIADYLSGRE